MSAIKNHYHDEITNGQVTVNEKHIHDWGRFDYQQELIRCLHEWRDNLDVQDVTAHVWLSKFETFVKGTKP